MFDTYFQSVLVTPNDRNQGTQPNDEMDSNAPHLLDLVRSRGNAMKKMVKEVDDHMKEYVVVYHMFSCHIDCSVKTCISAYTLRVH